MLTTTEQMQVKRHLGYSTVAPSLYPLADVWLTAGQILASLPDETETEVRDILTRLGNLETQIGDAPSRLKAIRLGSIELPKAGELDALWTEVKRWRRELSILTGLPMLRTGGQIVVT